MSRNQSAKTFKALHVPSQPIIVPNVWDIASFNAIASLNTDTQDPDNTEQSVKAVATSSWSIASSLGIEDEDLTYEQNLAAIKTLGSASKSLGIALTTDLGDGYGSKIEEVVAAVVNLGVVGGNIEDAVPSARHAGSIQDALYDQQEQVQRLKLALKAAADNDCPDFVLNARCDIFTLAPHPALSDEIRLEEGIKRGKAYLEAGATTVFFPTFAEDGLKESVVQSLVKELDGKVTLIGGRTPNSATTEQLAQLGVARVQFGAAFFLIARNATRDAARRVLRGGKLN